MIFEVARSSLKAWEATTRGGALCLWSEKSKNRKTNKENRCFGFCSEYMVIVSTLGKLNASVKANNLCKFALVCVDNVGGGSATHTHTLRCNTYTRYNVGGGSITRTLRCDTHTRCNVGGWSTSRTLHCDAHTRRYVLKIWERRSEKKKKDG